MKDVYERFFEMEKELSLFDFKIMDVYVWKLARMKVFFNLISKKGLISDRDRSIRFSQKLIKFVNVSRNSFFNSSFKRKNKVDYIIFENPRKVRLENDEYIDPFTSDFVDEIKKTKSSFEVVDLGHKGQHFNPPSLYRSYGESFYYDIFYKIFFKYIKIPFSIEEKEKIHSISKYIFYEFGVNVDVKSIFLSKLKEFDYQYKKYTKLFKVKECSKVFLVCSYGKEGVLCAARDKGIKVIEFQHGVMGKYHLGYNFPKNLYIPYFPDTIKCFGQYWLDTTGLPVEQVDVKVYGHPYLTNKLSKYIGEEKKQQILIISQPGNIKDLIDFAVASCEVNSDYLYKFRLHPKERLLWEKKIPLLYQASLEKSNLIVDSSSSDIYQSISESEYVVGVNSAALFEAIVLGAKLILLDSPGVETMDKVIESKHAVLLRKDEIANLSNSFDFSEDIDRSYYYKM